MSDHFIALAGEAPGPGGILVGVNRNAIAFVFGAFDRSIQRNVLRLHMCSGKTVQIEEEEDVVMEVLSSLRLAHVPWQLRLDNLESRDVG
jgi:hypothetical protein